MSQRLGLALLTLLGTSASTYVATSIEPAHARVPLKVCGAGGTNVLSIEVSTKPQHRGRQTKPDSSFQLTTTGAWTYVEHDRGDKLVREGKGCLSDAETNKLRVALAAQPWTITSARVRCRAYSFNQTTYRIGDKTVFVDETCGPSQLDAASRTALNDAGTLATKLIASVPKP